MIIYVIIYHIRNDKNYNIDMNIKYNTIITAIISAFCAAEKKKESVWYSNKSIYLNISWTCRGKKKRKKECITIIAYIAI